MRNRFDPNDFHQSRRSFDVPDFNNREHQTANPNSHIRAMNRLRGGMPKEFGNLTLEAGPGMVRNYAEQQHNDGNWMRSSARKDTRYSHLANPRGQQHFIPVQIGRDPEYYPPMHTKYDWRNHGTSSKHGSAARTPGYYEDRSSGHKKPEILPQYRKPEALPQNRRSEVLPQHQKPEVLPQNRKPEVLPQYQKPEVLPQYQKPEVLPQYQKPQVQPDSAKNKRPELPPFDSIPTRGLSTHTASPSKNGFAEALLAKLGSPVTSENLRFLDAWQKAEGGSADNPFNTIQSAPGARKMNHVGVKRYPSMEIGLQATFKAITNGRYGVILDALRQGDNAHRSAQALSKTPWGTGALVTKILQSRR